MSGSRNDREMNRNRIHPTVGHKQSSLLANFYEGRFSSVRNLNDENDSTRKFIETYIKKYGGEPTDAFGEMEFGSSNKTSKYVRVANNTNEEMLFQLLRDHWKLKMPNLVISVTGGAKNFTLRPRLKEMFRKSLIKVSESTGAWITTGGTHAGVMKHVGKAVKNYAAISDDNDRVVTIGIATWGVIYKNDLLVNKQHSGTDMEPKKYDVEEKNQGIRATLDENHSHFILVDGGEEKYGHEIELRAKLERCIASKTRPDKVKVMIVCVIVQGGPGSFETVHKSIVEGTPVVIVGGSGGWADVLAAASSLHPSHITPERVAELLTDCNMESAKNDPRLPQWTKMLHECVKEKNLLSVYDLDPSDSSNDLDIAILEALLKANVSDNQVEEQLNLAMAWNRSDIARSHILTDDASISKKGIANRFFSALRENKAGFCKLFLEYGVDLKEFCTVKRIESLYRSVPKDSVLYHKMSKHRKDGNFVLLDVGEVMRDYVGQCYVSAYKERKKNSTKYRAIYKPVDRREVNSLSAEEKEQLRNSAKMDDPYREIFQWAILANYSEIAGYVWEYMWESLPAAIMATRMLKVLADKTTDLDKKNQILENAGEYEALAIGILAKCFEDNAEKTTPLLIRKLDKWGGYTCLHVAIEANDKMFVSRPGVQDFFDKVWMGKLKDTTSLLVILIAGICLPLIWIIVPFRENEKKKIQDAKAIEAGGHANLAAKPNDVEAGNNVEMTILQDNRTEETIEFNSPNINMGDKKRHFSMFDKLILFYDAPIVTFWMNVYLILFAYIILSNFYDDLSVYEYVLLAWISTFLIEEMRELSDQETKSIKDKVIMHVKDYWNIMDITSLVLFYIGFGLRWNPEFLNTARILYSLSFMIQCVRIVHIFAVHHILGPKIIMVGKMLKDLLFFLFILVVFLLAYGVASQALLYHNEKDFGTIITGIIYKPYWQIYGELFLDEINYNSNTDAYTCSNTDSNLPRCPEETWAVPVLSALYLLFANVLLLNLLIAMFSYTFDNVQRQGNEIWKFQRYTLITDYYFRPPLVPPLIIFTHIYLFIRFIVRKIKKRTRDDPFSHALRVEDLTAREHKVLNKWEHWHAEAFLQSKRREDSMRPENQLQRLNDRMDDLMSTVDNLQEHLKTQKVERKRIQHISNMMETKFGNLEALISGGRHGGVPAVKEVKAVETPPPPKKTPVPASPSKPKHAIPEPTQDLHVKARSSPYPGSIVTRATVPDDKVSWKVAWPEYKPIAYTADVVLAQPPWADLPLESFKEAERPKLPYNKYDSKNKVARNSHIRNYEVADGFPKNPQGRTGISGRGQLGRYGPNHAADPVVTRWKRDSASNVIKIENKPVLEFVAIKRSDTGEWAIPGGMVDPGENVTVTLKREFSEEALNIVGSVNSEEIQEIKANVYLLFQSGGLEIYKGYCDDHRNTDIAWIETVARNFHDEEGTAFTNIPLHAGDEAGAVSWKTVNKNLKLFASHTHILKKAAEMHNAHF